MLDFKTMDNATLAASLATYNRWRKGEGEFADFKKQHPYKPSELTALMNEIVRRLPLIEAKDAEITDLKALYWEDTKALRRAAIKPLRENTTLKALLEQARELLDKVNEGDFSYLEGSEIYGEITKVLAAINAATGEK